MMSTKKKSSLLLVVPWSLVVLAAFASPAAACPLCKEAVPMEEAEDGTPPPATRTARAYAFSILIMLAVPFAIVGSGVLVLVSAFRRNLARQQGPYAEESSTAGEPPKA